MTEDIDKDLYVIHTKAEYDQVIKNGTLSYGVLNLPSYDFDAGDRRFSDREKALIHARRNARPDRTQFLRRDPGSYSFQALWLVQASDRVEAVI